MKSSKKDEAKGKMHQAKGKIKEIAGKVILNPDLEADGTDENIAGKVQEKLGQVKEVLRSIYEHKKESKSQRCKSVFNWYPSIRRSEHGNEQNP